MTTKPPSRLSGIFDLFTPEAMRQVGIQARKDAFAVGSYVVYHSPEHGGIVKEWGDGRIELVKADKPDLRALISKAGTTDQVLPGDEIPDDLASEFKAVVARMADHTETLFPADATEEELDRLAVELTKWALKRE